ncbi:hypothetical protein D2A34_24760 [Clostridium chromiireducens]|uniref:Uncharacterized protein n=1 Tax=Clostridium chromiireducens TaxID=225345 RepID=A0A399IGV9_9CLOT|nr:hypothetical protein [Clostridium chromiireducens]RII32134.1 hypothetical protein D2A34_24760 [Clostridium chromiireducens]
MDYLEKKTAQEVPYQEQLENIYPIQSTIINKVNDGIAVINGDTIIDASQAIRLEIRINDNRYNKNQVYESVKIACQKLLEYFR